MKRWLVMSNITHTEFFDDSKYIFKKSDASLYQDQKEDADQWSRGSFLDLYYEKTETIEENDTIIVVSCQNSILAIGKCKVISNPDTNMVVDWGDGFNETEIEKYNLNEIYKINEGDVISFDTPVIVEYVLGEIRKNNSHLARFFNASKDEEEPKNTVTEPVLSYSATEKIDSLRLAGFHFFRNEEIISFGGKNALIYGENGSGKTSLSEAFRFIFRMATDRTETLADHINIFPDDLRGGDLSSFLELKFTDNDNIIFIGETSAQDELADITELQKLYFIDPFIAYKDILQLYFSNIDTAGKPRNLFAFFNTILSDYLVPKGSASIRLSELQGDEYFKTLSKIIQELREQANFLLKKYFNRNMDISGFSFDAYERNITAQIHVYDTHVENYQTFLNEAKLTALGLSFFFAIIIKKSQVFNPKYKVLILDDLLISLDMSHREAVIELLTKGYFAEFQKIILTHERGFFNICKTRFKAGKERDNWLFWEMYERKENSDDPGAPYIIESKDYLEKAKELFNKCEYEECANMLRREAEKICGDFLGINEVNDKRGNIKNLEDLLNTVKGRVNQKETYAMDFKRAVSTALDNVKSCKDRVLNPFSHAADSPLYRKEIKDALDAVQTFKKILE